MKDRLRIHAIDADFDGGNIVVEDVAGTRARLKIRRDSRAPWAQWFHFVVRGDPGALCELQIVNAAECTYPDGWASYRACVSEDGRHWVRAETRYVAGVLSIHHQLTGAAVEVAYFAPYGLDAHARLLDHGAARGGRHQLALTPTGRAIERLGFGQGDFRMWLLGRQHPGEPMASWWMEGAVARLSEMTTQRADLFERASISVVPLVNPDGVVLGNLRANAAGRDLNREWNDPHRLEAPEVAGLLDEMGRWGADLVLDVHGDECVPHVFIDSRPASPYPETAQRQADGAKRFERLLQARNSAFQTAVGYPEDYAGDGAVGMCARAVSARFGAVGMTLEMPFSRSLEAPDFVADWSPQACIQLGRDCIDSLAAWMNHDP